MTYYSDDLARTITQDSKTRTWIRDPAGRLATTATSGLGSTASTNHYSDDSSDSAAWARDLDTAGTATIHRYLTGLAGDLLADLATTGGTTEATVQLVGLHGDVLRTTSPDALASPNGPATDADEYGQVRDTTTGDLSTGPRYTWLGGKQRPTDTGTVGVTLMGVRLYTPTTGRFLQVDPVYGGNPNAYTYPVNPINSFDLDGRWGWGDIGNFIKDNWVDIALTAAAFVPGVGVAAIAVRAVRIVQVATRVVSAASRASTAVRTATTTARSAVSGWRTGRELTVSRNGSV